ncbi:MAG TPA: hypothetical protein VGQ41_09415 [Pyrinomonadaceae bacterium]|nr:hypothetical protein [Pyrinomonadaceae bacterium]
MPDNSAPDSAIDGLHEHKDWLAYYSECCKYELVMGQKFTGLLGQASVFSFTAAAGIFTLAERLNIRYPRNLWVALPSMLGLFMYAVIIVKYFLQIRYIGGIMLKAEKVILSGLVESHGIIHVLRNSRGGFYGRWWTLGLVLAYASILVLLPLLTVAAVS